MTERSSNRKRNTTGWLIGDTNRLAANKEETSREEDLPAKEPAPQAHPWIFDADAYPAGSRCDFAEAEQGSQAARGVIPTGDGQPPAAVGWTPPSEALPREARLLQSGDFRRCYRRGRRRTGNHLIVYFVANAESGPRFGTTLSRKVGNSVVRHRIKRQLREVYRRSAVRRELPPVDLVVHVKPGSAGTPFVQLREELLHLLQGVGSSRGRGRSR